MPTDTSNLRAVATSGDFQKGLQRSVEEGDRLRAAQLQEAQAKGEQRQGALALESSRLTLKYGERSPQAQHAQAQLEAQKAVVAQTKAAARRAQVPTVTQTADEAAYYGIVTDTAGAPQCGFTVQARDARDQVLGHGDTDAKGNYRFSVAPGKLAGSDRVLVESAARATTVKLAVTKNGRLSLRDDKELPLTAGRAVYRELTLPHGGQCGDQPG